MNNNKARKLTREKKENNNKARKLKPLTEKDKEIIWISLSWE